MAKITKEKVTSCLKGSWLTLATLTGVIGGVILGVCLKQGRTASADVNEKQSQFLAISYFFCHIKLYKGTIFLVLH